jgi:RNA polymerase primary sigma factor
MKQLTIASRITSYDENSFKRYLNDVDRIPLMTPDEESKVAFEAQRGNEEALVYLINANLRFVISVAKQYVDKNNKIEDLVNEGNIGLIIAARKFDPSKGFKFISYAVWWIRRTIQEYKFGAGDFIRKPTNRITTYNKYKETKSLLECVLEREPTKEEIIDGMKGYNIELVDESEYQEVQSLDKEIGEDGFCLKDIIINGNNINDEHNNEDIKHKMDLLLTKITPREREIIELSYGLTGTHSMTLEEIGEKINLTREGVRQIKNKALFKLKMMAYKMDIDFYGYNDIIF